MDILDKRIIRKRVDVSYCIRMVRQNNIDVGYWKKVYKSQIEFLNQLLNQREINKFQEVLNGDNKCDRKFK